jgi:motility quorum-sensing regulator/GCU-specific mRNA interferase toxin
MLPFNEHTPTYDLQQVQQLIGQGELSRVISHAAAEAADKLDFSREDVVEAVLSLAPGDFYKSMEAERLPGLWQDVYHLRYRGIDLYIKLQIDTKGRAVVIQFKRK